MTKDVTGFLTELGELTLKYGIAIGGCGCCGSPYLIDPNGDTEINGMQHDELKWDNELGIYALENVYETPQEMKSND